MPSSNSSKRVVTWNRRSYLCVLLVSLLLLAVTPAVQADEKPRMHPALAKLVKERPDGQVRVIVQRKKQQELSDKELEKHGGKKGKGLPLIDGDVVEMPIKDVEKLARHPSVRWISIDAPVRSSGTTGYHTYRDEFSSISYSGSNGNQSWSTNPWTELGESDGTGAGRIKIVADSYCASGSCLRIGILEASMTGKEIYRKINLNNATSATLSFSYRRWSDGHDGGNISLMVSGNDGATWQTLATYLISATDSNQITQSFDISAYANQKTRIRFLGSGNLDGYLYVDNIQIEYMRLSNGYVKRILADKAWKELSNDAGQGVTVAVVDSGINGQHSDLQNGSISRVIHAINWSTGSTNTADENGHGTHMAGIIGGVGAMSSGARMGVAPKVNLLNIKVMNAQGRSYTSDVVNALQWIYDNRNIYNIKVVNLSLNSTVAESYHTSPLSAAVEILWFNKIVVVVSAGNNGTGSGPVTLYPPANDPFVITVGAMDDKDTNSSSDDVTPAFSAYGITENGFAKPDITAPGMNIISTLASTSSHVYVNYPNNRVDANYFRMSGTSAAAAVATGAVALLLQDEPTLTPDQVKYRLKATANTSWAGYNAGKAGAGVLDIHAAIKGTTSQSANTGIAASNLLFTGTDPLAWNSVDWNSVDWNSVDWNSVDWNSVDWNSTDWNSVIWN